MQSSALVAACHSAACRPPTVGGTGGSTKTREFDRRIRSGSESVRSAAEAQLAESIYSGKTAIYHGSKADLKVGDVIKPTNTNANKPGDDRPKAFATRNLETTSIFGRPFVTRPDGPTLKIYKVEPIGKDLEFVPTTELGVHIMSAKGFKITEVLDRSPIGPTMAAKRRESIRNQEKIAQVRRTRKANRAVASDPKLKAAIDQLAEALR